MAFTGTTPSEVRINASHLSATKVNNDTLQAIIDDVHVLYIADYVEKFKNQLNILAKLKVIEKLLSQHMATINIRRADSEGAAGMSKSISVPKSEDFGQTEYGQMAQKIAKDLGLDWSRKDLEPASVRIY